MMISGYTMLDKQDSYCKTFHRFVHYLLCLLLFSGFYYVFLITEGKVETPGVVSFLSGILSEPITNAYWYLYTYLGILLMIPFVQKMVASFDKKDFHVYFLISGVFYAVWPIAVHYITSLRISDHFFLPVYNSYLCMLLLGCYVKRYCTPSRKGRNICLVGFAGFCMMNVLLTYSEYVRLGGIDYLFFDDRVLLPIMASAFCLFYAVSTIPFGERFQRGITILGSLTFGIYMISDFLIRKFEFVYFALNGKNVYPLISILVYEVLVFGVGAGITWVLKKIPGLKRIV